jgi:hypothetical protein
MPAVAIGWRGPQKILRAMTVLKGGRFRVKADVGLQVKISPIPTEVTLIELGRTDVQS